MFNYLNISIFQYLINQIINYLNNPIFKYLIIPIFKYSNILIFEYAKGGKATERNEYTGLVTLIRGFANSSRLVFVQTDFT